MTALFTAALFLASTPPAVSDLRCEYLKSPLAVDESTPRLSWAASSSVQTAYQVLVASSEATLAQDKGDLWDSGKVAGQANSQVAYSGRPLIARQDCFWKVRLWTGGERPGPWSRVATWGVGLKDWVGSEWIGTGQPGPAPYLRKEFRLEAKPVRARLFAAGLGYAELHVNGHKLGENTERDPAYTNFDKRLIYVAYDVTRDLKRGLNCLGGILGTGWYDVHDLATWNFDRAAWRGRPRLKSILYIDFADGRTQTVTSDGTWQAGTGPILTDGIYSGELYDARKEIPGWDRVGYPGAGWRSASVMTSPKGKLVSRPCTPVVIGETIKPIAITEPKPGVFVVDFGQNFSGHAQIHVKGDAGRKITMKYSERLDKAGMIQRSEIDVYMTKTKPPQPFQMDEYICKGAEDEVWEQRFSYSGFRYMEVTGFPGRPTLDSFRGRFAHTDLEPAGSFACSSDLFNKIQHATLYSYLSNAQSIFTDCPQREKNGWTGDAQLACEAGLMNFQSIGLYEKWLDDFADCQLPDGRAALIVPTAGWGRGGCNPAWDSALPIIANDLYDYSGDLRPFERHYDDIKRYVDYLSGKSPDGTVPFDSLGDWLPWSTETSSQLTSTVCLYADAHILAKAAHLLNKPEDAATYTALAERVKTAFRQKWFGPADLAGNTQAALSMALYFDMLTPGEKPLALKALVENVERQGHIDTGILGAKFILRALSEAGRTDVAYKLVAHKEQPGWGWWMTQGATTLWEDWKGESSLNHIMFGDVSNWFYQWIAGIGLDPNVPGFRRVIIHPQVVGDLTWVKASYLAPTGRIAASWRRDGNRFEYDLEVPAGVTAQVQLPGVAAGKDLPDGEYHGGHFKFVRTLRH